MRVGIITFHGSDNFGSVLQAFSLLEVLREEGFEAEIIDYQFTLNYKQYDVVRWHSYFFLPTLKSDIIFHKIRKERKEKFKDFRNSYFKLSERSYKNEHELTQCNSLYDSFICGSDQIWNTYCTGRKVNAGYFLEFVEDKKLKIAYAVSMGDNQIPNRLAKEFEYAVNRIDYVSFREKKSELLVRPILPQKKIYTVADPTILHDATFYKNIILKHFQSQPRNNEGKFAFLYILGRITPNRTWIESALNFLETTGLEIIYWIDDYDLFNHKLAKYKNVSNCHPVEFLDYIARASLVVSNSFHCTVFSSIFNKDFITVERLGSNNRLYDFLSFLSIENKIVSTKASTEDFLNAHKTNIDFTIPNKRLSELRESSKNFLISALERKL